ncbi:MAG: pyridoxamine 5'-phosphate oxidase family protein [Syntrophorhabdaceae bacterium]|nr:pyridoxamine 5'-phosphate oxidase family protein [Syntrophorhabdaceae bacterium]MDD5242480.1 pyridoxamine 5'-phosphate oxidase family protein [Syntrophorhabdaceae bacterium]
MKKYNERIPGTTQRGSVSVPDRLQILDRTEDFAVLATDDQGMPYTSLVSFALTPDLKKAVFATPRNTRKYKNIISSRNVALLIDNRSRKKKGLMETEAVTIIGKGKPVKKGRTRDELAALFIKKHPDLEGFIYSPSTALIIIDIVQCIHVSRFQTVSVWNRI